MNLPSVSKPVLWSIAGGAVVILSVGAGLYQYKRLHAPPEPAILPAPAVVPPVTASVDEPPAVQHPLPAPPPEPLPALDDSDVPFHQQLLSLFGASLDQMLIPDNIVRHLVVSIDNLPRKKLPAQSRPLKAAPGNFTVKGSEDALTLDPANDARYAVFVKLIQDADPQQVVDLYLRYHRLLQQSYQSLGNSTAYFNDRVVEAIDNLLATPELTGPVKLVQPNVLYEFADRDLENRSAGQKLLLRMGPANTALIKAKLRDVRSRIATVPP